MNCGFTKEANKIINFQPRNSHTSPLFKQNSILKFQDKIYLEYILFVSKSLNNLTPSVFSTWFSFSSDQHNYDTSSSKQFNLIKLYKTNIYEKYSITVSVLESWNKIQKQCNSILSPRKIKTVVSNLKSLIVHWSWKKNNFDMWFCLVHSPLEELYKLLITCVRFLFTALFFVI